MTARVMVGCERLDFDDEAEGVTAFIDAFASMHRATEEGHPQLVRFRKGDTGSCGLVITPGVPISITTESLVLDDEVLYEAGLAPTTVPTFAPNAD